MSYKKLIDAINFTVIDDNIITLGTLLDTYDHPFEARRLGFAVMGISGLSSDTMEVQRLVGQLAKKAKGAWGDINSQELSMCLHG